MATVLKEKVTSSASLSIVLPILLVIILIGATITVFVFVSYLYKRHNKTNRAYQVNDVTQSSRHSEPTIALREGLRSSGTRRQAPPPPPHLRRISALSTATSARSSTTSFEWNLAYFLFKVLGSGPDAAAESPIAPGPQAAPVTAPLPAQAMRNTRTLATAVGSTATVHLNAATDIHLESPDYEVIGGQRDEDINEKPTDFNEEEYLHVLA